MTVSVMKAARDRAAQAALAVNDNDASRATGGSREGGKPRRRLPLGLSLSLAVLSTAGLATMQVLPDRIEIDVASIRTWLAVAFCATCFIGAAAALAFLIPSRPRERDQKRDQPSLDELSEPEREVIERCLRLARRTILCSIDDPGPTRLRQRGWLVLAAGSHPRRAWPHTIPAPLWPI